MLGTSKVKVIFKILHLLYKLIIIAVKCYN